MSNLVYQMAFDNVKVTVRKHQGWQGSFYISSCFVDGNLVATDHRFNQEPAERLAIRMLEQHCDVETV